MYSSPAKIRSMVDELSALVSQGNQQKTYCLARQVPVKALIKLIAELSDNRQGILWLMRGLLLHPAPGHRNLIGQCIGRHIRNQDEADQLVALYKETGAKYMPSQLQAGLMLAKQNYE